MSEIPIHALPLQYLDYVTLSRLECLDKKLNTMIKDIKQPMNKTHEIMRYIKSLESFRKKQKIVYFRLPINMIWDIFRIIANTDSRYVYLPSTTSVVLAISTISSLNSETIHLSLSSSSSMLIDNVLSLTGAVGIKPTVKDTMNRIWIAFNMMGRGIEHSYSPTNSMYSFSAFCKMLKIDLHSERIYESYQFYVSSDNMPMITNYFETEHLESHLRSILLYVV